MSNESNQGAQVRALPSLLSTLPSNIDFADRESNKAWLTTLGTRVPLVYISATVSLVSTDEHARTDQLEIRRTPVVLSDDSIGAVVDAMIALSSGLPTSRVRTAVARMGRAGTAALRAVAPRATQAATEVVTELLGLDMRTYSYTDAKLTIEVPLGPRINTMNPFGETTFLAVAFKYQLPSSSDSDDLRALPALVAAGADISFVPGQPVLMNPSSAPAADVSVSQGAGSTGLKLLVGQTGSGKSTLIRKLVSCAPNQVAALKFGEQDKGDNWAAAFSVAEVEQAIVLSAVQGVSHVIIDSLRPVVYSGQGAAGPGGFAMGVFFLLYSLDALARRLGITVVASLNPLLDSKPEDFTALIDRLRASVDTAVVQLAGSALSVTTFERNEQRSVSTSVVSFRASSLPPDMLHFFGVEGGRNQLNSEPSPGGLADPGEDSPEGETPLSTVPVDDDALW